MEALINIIYNSLLCYALTFLIILLWEQWRAYLYLTDKPNLTLVFCVEIIKKYRININYSEICSAYSNANAQYVG